MCSLKRGYACLCMCLTFKSTPFLSTCILVTKGSSSAHGDGTCSNAASNAPSACGVPDFTITSRFLLCSSRA